MKIRPAPIFWIVMWCFAACGLYMVKYKVQNLRNEVATAETQLHTEQKNLHVLKAEWTFLNRPERLAQLAAKYLHVQPMKGNQLADLSNLPTVAPAKGPIQLVDDEEAMPSKTLTLASGAAHAR